MCGYQQGSSAAGHKRVPYRQWFNAGAIVVHAVCCVYMQEVLQRRLGCVFGSSKERSRKGGRLVVIDFVVAGQLAAFRARERMTSLAVQEMPVHVPDVFV